MDRRRVSRGFPIALVAMAAAATALAPFSAFAHEKFGLGLEPFYGMDRALKTVPTEHSHNRGFWGARIWFGKEALAFETEVAEASDIESFPTIDLSTRDSDLMIKAGARFGIPLSRDFWIRLRLGGQGLKRTHEETTGGINVKTAEPWSFHPYAGIGAGWFVAGSFELTLGAAWISSSSGSLAHSDYQASLGASFRLL